MAMAVRIRTSAETGGRVVLVFFVCFISSFIISHSYWEGVVQAAPNSVLESALELDHSNSNPNTEPENPNQNDRAQNGSAQNDSACEHHLVPFHFSSVDHQQQKQNHDSTSSSSSTSWEDDITLAVHHNGNPAICGTAPFSLRLLRSALVAMTACASESESEDDLSKYQVESLLTEFFASALQQGDGGADCGVVVASDAAVDSAADTASGDTTGTLNGITSGLLSFCDMGPEKTVVQNDFDDLIHVPSSDTLPCRWFTREGLRITSLAQMGDLLQEQTRANNNCTTSTTNNNGDAAAPESQTCAAQNMLHLYAAPAGRVFMFAPSFVGETFTINHVKDADEKIITLEVLSLEPRVFDIVNFFNEQESNELVEKALKETSETYRFHRSTTGTSGASVFNKRTSENAWDTHGATALKVKRRCFSLLGIDEYDESMADGLQILRYNLTTAYTSHLDYLEDRAGTESYDYDSAGKGGNRFATILLYFTDLGERDGGETVFSKVWPPGVPTEERLEMSDAIAQLRASGDAEMLKHGSWEEEMTAQCRTRFSIRPKARRAVLFYSQFPNGAIDQLSFHGGCPVLRGTKLAANLWTWSGIRPEYDGAPRKFEEDEREKPAHDKIYAIFENTGGDPRFQNAEVYYDEDGYFGKLGFGDPPVSVNTYAGHKWNIKVEGKTLQTFVIEEGTLHQQFVV